MPHYRCCQFDARGSLVETQILRCANDDDAKRAAQTVTRHAACHSLELWQVNRCLITQTADELTDNK